MSLQKLIIRSIQQETVDTKCFTFENSPALVYQPGQFLTLVRKTLTQEVRRQYSFSSHPQLDSYPRITVKRIANGEVSRWLFDEAREGDAIASAGASGFFTLPESTTSSNKVLLLAAGSGITPMLSLIKEMLHFHSHLSVVLIYSNHNEESTIFLDELRILQKHFAARFTIEFLFSNAKNLMRARLGKSVLEELLRQHLPQPEQSLAFVCGPLDYRQMAIVTLLAHGLSIDTIHKEVFHTPEARTKPLPPDQDEHTVSILFKNGWHDLNVQYPVSILSAAKLQGLDLPYSCEAGRCGACTATCTKGMVWMSRNEVLTESDVANGRILTCTAHPIEGDVSIKF